ncbi:MAG: hypothetical protein KC474_09985 [Cyanobacteria bacterium HKST-UBA04]|nr:hypothetical protein [Cyanobacteria bacterium HKST-UBA05]MCA9799868.1 hypothetical protein [Cyanobacteria bacterium HKST-UBA04]MCA9842034.1 hypothetical protein [Cyanobacteria bacterium HKST-UBA03]
MTCCSPVGAVKSGTTAVAPTTNYLANAGLASPVPPIQAVGFGGKGLGQPPPPSPFVGNNIDVVT